MANSSLCSIFCLKECIRPQGSDLTRTNSTLSLKPNKISLKNMMNPEPEIMYKDSSKVISKCESTLRLQHTKSLSTSVFESSNRLLRRKSNI